MKNKSKKESWIRKVLRFYTVAFAFLFLSWGMLLFVNLVYPYLAAPELSADALTASVVHVSK